MVGWVAGWLAGLAGWPAGDAYWLKKVKGESEQVVNNVVKKVKDMTQKIIPKTSEKSESYDPQNLSENSTVPDPTIITRFHFF